MSKNSGCVVAFGVVAAIGFVVMAFVLVRLNDGRPNPSPPPGMVCAPGDSSAHNGVGSLYCTPKPQQDGH